MGHNATTMLDLTKAAGNESGNETEPANSSISKASSQVNLNASPLNASPVLKIGGECSSSEDDQPKSKELKLSTVISEINSEIAITVTSFENEDSNIPVP